jgi:hypothetical protein
MTRRLDCTHETAMRAALEEDADCPVCIVSDELRNCHDQTQQEVARHESTEQTLIREQVEGVKQKEKRKKTTKITAKAECRECKWTADHANAMPLAAQHHDRTEHTVDVEQHMELVYGDPDRHNKTNPEEVF